MFLNESRAFEAAIRFLLKVMYHHDPCLPTTLQNTTSTTGLITFHCDAIFYLSQPLHDHYFMILASISMFIVLMMHQEICLFIDLNSGYLNLQKRKKQNRLIRCLPMQPAIIVCSQKSITGSCVVKRQCKYA